MGDLVGYLSAYLAPEVSALVRQPSARWGAALLLWVLLAVRLFGRSPGRAGPHRWMRPADWAIVSVIVGAVWLGFRSARW